MCIVGTFLPRVDSASLLHIADNSLIQSGDGIIVIILALAGAGRAYGERASSGFDLQLFLVGVLLTAAAIYFGTGDRIVVENGFGEAVESSEGTGILAVGIGGVLMVIASTTTKAPPPRER